MDKHLFSSTSRAFGIKPQLSGALYQELLTWIRSSGPEWTVKRLKSMKLFVLGTLQPSNRMLRGSWGALCTSTQYPLSTKLNMLHVYHWFVSEEPTPTQLDKFYSSMESTDQTGLDTEPTKTNVRKVLGRRKWNPFPKEYILHPTNPQKRIPVSYLTESNGETQVSSLPEDGSMTMFYNDVAMTMTSPLWNLYRNHGGEDTRYLHPSLELLFEEFLENYGNLESINPHGVVGKIGFIHEPGFKLRAVANPIRFGQWLLSPLKDTLLERLRVLPEDCTFDQEKGIRWVQGQLKQGKTCYSIDLSDATNLFPWKYQFKIISTLIDEIPFGSPEWHCATFLKRTLSVMAKGKWDCPDGQSRKFTRGQPLGLGPSFPLFALAHHVVLKSINGSQGKYVILGDDICISDPVIAKEYMKVMQSLGSQLSPEKTITSNKMAEFAGKLITSRNVMSKYKWLPIRMHNVVDILRVHGPKVLPLVPVDLLDVVPTLCALPRYLGGCGFTLRSPYDKMVDNQLIQKIKDKPQTLVSYHYIPKEHRIRMILQDFSLEDASEVVINTYDRYFVDNESPRDFPLMHKASSLPKDQEPYYIKTGLPAMMSSRSMVTTARRLRTTA